MNFDSFKLAASVSDLSVEPRAREHADVLEFRMDLATEPLSALDAYDGELPVLATNRVTDEGGSAPAGTDRLATLRAAADAPAVGAIDLELSAVRSEEGQEAVAAAENAGIATVVSAHDFDGTPSRERMRETLRAATDSGTVGKLAVTATDRGDVLDLLSVTHDLATAGRRVATMAMGETGRHSRAVAPLYGSRIGYAPVDPHEATAPGQYDLATLAGLVDELA